MHRFLRLLMGSTYVCMYICTERFCPLCSLWPLWSFCLLFPFLFLFDRILCFPVFCFVLFFLISLAPFALCALFLSSFSRFLPSIELRGELGNHAWILKKGIKKGEKEEGRENEKKEERERREFLVPEEAFSEGCELVQTIYPSARPSLEASHWSAADSLPACCMPGAVASFSRVGMNSWMYMYVCVLAGGASQLTWSSSSPSSCNNAIRSL